ncbi:endonuclease/exonuclease/phosphatase family protein [Rhodophyticola sp. CCM32]|uniref:endonuclease/exonuclease/phosphatase family protein n=1 Tax=Rhodophyticola sp. CCM32 TaxID=2916397 RepID=UPI00107F3F0C|nr:endonuclease/exonuclease/phosphatase family protein [Rhodophyticola sp. CCM32]QBY01449.1 endonuclease/exonuclease/phosphatase family protein [Rhodophyticola sp. CCM32]
MRFISLNAWGGQVWSALKPWMPAMAPDILCLQEVTRAPVPSPDWLRYVDPYRALDQRADLFGDISALLPDHQSAFAPATRGSLQDKAGQNVASEHGQAVWVAPHLAVTEQWQGFIHGRFRPDGWGAEPVSRTMQILRICDPKTGGQVVCAHFHGLRDPSGKGDTPARAAQAKAVCAALRAFLAPGEPLILAGDFNLLPDSASFAEFAALGLTDLVTTRGFTDTRTSLYPKPQRFADYLLVTPEVRVAEFDLPALPEMSDHRPMILDFDV